MEPVIKHRTYDPEKKTLKKHSPDEDVEMDTVEKRVDGLAEQIIKEDEERRAQDLVRVVSLYVMQHANMNTLRTCTILHPNVLIGTLNEI